MNYVKIYLQINRGANGSGKSTLARELLLAKNLEFLNADDTAKEFCSDNIESVKIKTGKIVLEKLDKLLLNKKSFAIEMTMLGTNHIKTIERAKILGYKTINILQNYQNQCYFFSNRLLFFI